MAQSLTNRPDNTLVLLFSGGMDSYIAYKLFKPDVCLYVAINHRYQDKELEAIGKLQEADSELNVTIDKRLDLSDMEEAGGMIPLRNLFLVSIASYHGDSIILGKIKGNSTADKSEKFRYNIQSMLTRLDKDSDNISRNIAILFPLKTYTKRALIKKYLKDHTYEPLQDTVSCYHESEWRCGKCLACFRRWTAMSLNGIEEGYTNHPAQYYRNHITKRSFQLRRFITALPANYNGWMALRQYTRYTSKRGD